ncbi:hypothetical protein SAZ11_04135 [Streptomyces sp. FXJ1.4098]|nr:hypothetical protein [Streptomyces sp. FXJ1.4098]
MPGSDISYRAYRNTWTGTPCYPPSAAARTEGGHTVVYASWNGSTPTRAWQVLAGPDADSLSVVVEHAMRSGFETTTPTTNRGPYFQVRALDAAGKVLRVSKVVKLGSVDTGVARRDHSCCRGTASAPRTKESATRRRDLAGSSIQPGSLCAGHAARRTIQRSR